MNVVKFCPFCGKELEIKSNMVRLTNFLDNKVFSSQCTENEKDLQFMVFFKEVVE